MSDIWHRQAGEPAKWYSRFESYLSLGPERSIHMTFVKVREERSGALASNWSLPVGGYHTWRIASGTWKWAERAEAWDDYNRENLARRQEQRRIDERETRLKIITQQLHVVESALLSAQLDTLTVGDARRLLPSLGRLLKDMLDQQRMELEPPPFRESVAAAAFVPFTGDELAAAARELADAALWASAMTGGIPGGMAGPSQSEEERPQQGELNL